MFFRISIFTLVLSLLSPMAMADTTFRVGANLGSLHVKPEREFNQFNPGLFVSATFRSERVFSYGVQAGAYLNSYSERSIYASTYANWRIAQFGNTSLRFGGFVGLFEYPELSVKARSIGWPTVGDYVLALGPSLKLELGSGVDFTVSFLPVKNKRTAGVFTFQMSIPFGQRH